MPLEGRHTQNQGRVCHIGNFLAVFVLISNEQTSINQAMDCRNRVNLFTLGRRRGSPAGPSRVSSSAGQYG
jgi:hypothetical protein